MRPEGRYWIFFVIVAVGLALSWGQIGRKTEQAMRDRPAIILANEKPCLPRQSACAATGSDRALLLGPGVGRGLRLRQVGLPPSAIDAAEVVYIASDGGMSQPRPLILDHDGWLLPGGAEGAVAARVQLQVGQETTLAEFPL